MYYYNTTADVSLYRTIGRILHDANDLDEESKRVTKHNFDNYLASFVRDRIE